MTGRSNGNVMKKPLQRLMEFSVILHIQFLDQLNLIIGKHLHNHVKLIKIVLISQEMLIKNVHLQHGMQMINRNTLDQVLPVIIIQRVPVLKVQEHSQLSMKTMQIPNSVIILKIGAWVMMQVLPLIQLEILLKVMQLPMLM
jgi:hypothetical protein